MISRKTVAGCFDARRGLRPMKNSTLRKGGDVPTPRAGNSQVSPTRKVWSVAMRTITITAAILFCLMSATLPAQSPPTSSPPEQVQAVTALPETPAGKQFAAWLAAVNTGRRETLRQFISENYAPPRTAPCRLIRSLTGSSRVSMTRAASMSERSRPRHLRRSPWSCRRNGRKNGW